MKRILAPLIIGALGAGILLWLGTWQMQRLAWKEGILSEIETVIAGPPQPLPVLVDPSAQRYQPVMLTGAIEAEGLYVLVSVKRQGAGWRIVSSFVTDDGRRVLVDRGFTPVDQKDTPLATGAVRLRGNLHWPDDRTSSTPENDPAANTWFARDIGAMAEALRTEPLLVIAAEMSPPDAHVTPMPVDTSGIPNDHLQYAVTWFLLAAVWLLMTGLWITRSLKGKEG
ncbi:SURF1 family protein [Cognatishimia sp. F0-27]|uniref:SURF1 family protein n=1 Tax=Cognatishimia sp. F0-27 TaxID=2816855 RepID=UPI001D0C9444|nr:SURF1 family protein [Cognatishimia sp. F0-27]